ncbi:Pas41 [Actinoplanes phage phiAsp2]|uniref:Pas41 n=1 Tax=Actinoplanes phage phiAsp2 TaxID=279303 RepID=Q6J7Z0_9CAUD|nr:Pas41 [Actinoplanes phage phiAsp2]AAT36789.1 Pas41 [Actinoplanes phage phiAsp2]
MGSIAKGKVNASEATEGMRIIVKVSYDAEGHATIRPSSTKTGEGVFVARIIEKGFRAAGRYEARGKYVIHTSAGSFDAAPIQTMWLAPEDPAGIKRARAEADLVERGPRRRDRAGRRQRRPGRPGRRGRRGLHPPDRGRRGSTPRPEPARRTPTGTPPKLVASRR